MTCVLDAHDHTGDAAAAGRVLSLMRRSSKSSSSSSDDSSSSSSSSAKVNPAALLSGARAHARAGQCEIALQLLDEVSVLNTCTCICALINLCYDVCTDNVIQQRCLRYSAHVLLHIRTMIDLYFVV
jgi:hypothetical protein